MMLKAHIHSLKGFSPKEKEIFMEAVELCLEVFNSRDFRRKMRRSEFLRTKGKSGRDIWKHILSGRDLYTVENDRDVDLSTTLYFEDNNVIGFTRRGTFKTWINKKFFMSKTRGAAGRASNIAHEYMHNLGYSHSHKWNPTRKDTVPYKVGYIVKDLAKEILKDRR